MSITHVTTHRLQCSTEGEARLSLRQDELTPDETKQALLDKLKSSFLVRLSRKHGRFNSEGDVPVLSQKLEAFLADEGSFAEMSVALMEQLKGLVAEKGVELDAHFLFFVEKSYEHHHIFYLFITHQSESLAISDELDVTPTYSIDTGPSLFGVKVDLVEWKDKRDYAYLSMVPPRGNAIFAELFEEWVGFANGIDKEASTEAFLQGVESFAKKLPEEQVNEYRAKVVDYCMEKEQSDEPVSIPGLSKELGGIDCDQFLREMTAYNPKLSEGEDEVMIDRRSLKRYVKFAGRDKDLAVSFSSYQLNSRVHYNQDNDTLQITGLPKALRKQLLKHLNES